MGKWDYRFIALAEHVSAWSKDPSTQVGAVIADSQNRIVSLGFNGPARALDDRKWTEPRDLKIACTMHAEVNAILFARSSLLGCTIYTWPWPPCSNCAALIIQSGLSRVVSPALPHLSPWADSMRLGQEMLREAGVTFDQALAE